MFDTVFARDVQQTLDHFRRSVDQLFDNALNSDLRTMPSTQQASESFFNPVVESGWNEHELCIRAVVPGVDEKDLTVNLQGNRLLIEGERKVPENWTKARSTQLGYGKFRVSFSLPQGLELERLGCRLHNGVLDITAPVAEQAKPRQIQVHSAEPSKQINA